MEDRTALSNSRLAFVGCGVMAEAIIAGLLRKKLVGPEQISGSHPRQARREEIHVKYGVEMFENNRDAITGSSVFVLAVKPQRLHRVLEELKGAPVKEQLVVSIVAGARIATIAEELLHASIVRAMPNTPAQIGEGVTAWSASADVSETQERQVCAMLEALGKTVHVENEHQIDMATALSATGPTYIFLMMEEIGRASCRERV